MSSWDPILPKTWDPKDVSFLSSSFQHSGVHAGRQLPAPCCGAKGYWFSRLVVFFEAAWVMAPKTRNCTKKKVKANLSAPALVTWVICVGCGWWWLSGSRFGVMKWLLLEFKKSKQIDLTNKNNKNTIFLGGGGTIPDRKKQPLGHHSQPTKTK